MGVLINFKICDNSEDCSGIEVCPTGAFHWGRKNKKLTIDESKCINCGMCEKSCPVGAIRFARDEEEYKKIKKEIDEDPRKVSNLFVDRYGAVPTHPAFLLDENKFNIQILRSTKLAVVELFNDDSIECLVKSIPVKELFKGIDIKYRKMGTDNEPFLKKYGVKNFPGLLFFKDGKLIGKIEGYYDVEKKKELIKKIDQITQVFSC